VLLRYDQIKSDFYDPIVKECRGLILHVNGNQVIPVCVPFYKFGNYSEGYSDKIDWVTARIQEKVDGSIIRLWYYFATNQWMLSSNGMVDAFECDLQVTTDTLKTFGDAFVKAVGKPLNEFVDVNHLDPHKTYIFELTGPHNKVVINYPLDVYQIGVRDNITLREEPCSLSIKRPKEYRFTSFDETIAFAKTLSTDQEGYVVVDGDWHRVKIKGDRYVRLTHMRMGSSTPKQILTTILSNEDGEFLTYFPEQTESFAKIKDKLNRLITEVRHQLDEMEDLKNQVVSGRQTREYYARIASTKINQLMMFDFLNDKLDKDKIELYLLKRFDLKKLLELCGIS
jgi:hypothetical protein